MTKLLRVFLYFVLIAGLSPVLGQGHFKVIGDIPHLPVIVLSSIIAPEEGMLVFSSTDLKPMIYTGSSWETLCTENISSLTAQEYFIVKNGIPFLPAFFSPPTGVLASGTIYYSTVNKALMVYNGSSWIKMIDLSTGSIAVNSGFSAGVGVKTVKLPVLSSNPSPSGLVAGAFYINSTNKIVRYYDGSLWQDISCQAVVHTLSVNSITSYTAMSGGNVTTNGGSPVTLTGICWSPVADPDTMLTSKTKLVATGSGVGQFTSQLTGLLPQTTYHVRAYAVNSVGIVYGEDSILTTPIQPPTIITLDANNITSISALSGGDITFDGGSPITKRGIIWSSLSDPLNDPSQVVTNDGSGVGYFPSTLDALLGLTTYYVRAYAVNAAGTSYGNLVVFTTPAPVVAALNQTLSISGVTDVSALATGLVLNNGGALVTERGICYSTDQVNYTYLASSTVNHTDIGTFTASLSGLLPGVTYYVKGYARNSVGTGYSSETSFITISLSNVVTTRPVYAGTFSAQGGGDILNAGYSTITGYGICWSMDKNPTIALSTKTTQIVSGDGTGIFTSTMNGLLNNTTYYVRAYAVNAAGVAYGNQDSVYTAPVTSAVLTTTKPSSITGVTAVSGGTVSSTGNDLLTARGVCWSQDTILTTALATKTSDPIVGLGKGAFGSRITGLTPGTKYYVRAYAVNTLGTSYGSLDSMVTATTAILTTTPPSSVTNTIAVLGGLVTSDGHDPVSERGVCWSLFPNPTVVDTTLTGGSGIGSYSVNVTNLLGSIKYYVRAYATNSVGTAYGNLDSLKTLPPVLGSVTTMDVINIGGTTAVGKGKVDSNGGALAEERGFCWNTTGNATVDGNHVACGLGNGGFSGTLTGLTPNTTYYFRAYVINTVGVSYGDDMTFSTFTVATLVTTPASVITSITAQSGGTILSDGGALVTASGICWNTTGNPTVGDKKTVSGLGIGNFIHSLTELMGSTTYYIRAYATNSAGTAYGNIVSFTTAPPILPTLTTAAAQSDDTGLTGTGGGTITSNGGGVITTEGIVWSTTSGFLPDTVTVNKTVLASSGDFTSSLINLQLGSTYYVRAYATNIAGTTYASNEVSFTTYMLPVITTVVPGSVTNVTAISGGNIISTGGAVVKESGICWSTGSLPTISDEVLSDGPGSGLFTRTIPDLMGSITYYVRAYVRTTVGLVYGQVESFTTAPPVLATILTVQPVATSATGGTSGGNILSHGGSMVTSRGIYWSTQENFDPDTITNGKTAQTGYYKGVFNAALTGLIPNTVYYVKAYVVNGVGVSYGAEMSFLCPALATLTTATATSNGPTKAVSGGNITNDGGAPITSRGVVWSTVASFNPDTVVVNITSDGGGTGSFVSQPKGLKGNTTYYVRAYAGSLAGTSYGNIVSFITDPATLATLSTRGATFVYGTSAQSGGSVANNGGEPITSSGVVWATSPYFRPDTVVVNKTVQGAAGIGLFGSSIDGLSYGTTYYVVAYAMNSIGIAYGDMVSFTTFDFPTLTTLPVYASSNGTQASGGGTLISNGGTPLTNQGVCWSVNPNPTSGLYTKTTKDGFSGNSFHSTLTGLSPVTKYYVRAYADNREGTSYGNEVSFTTPAILPAITTIYATPTTTSTVATGGSITFDGGSAVTARGVLWSTNQNFNPDTVVVNRTSNGTGNGDFTSMVTNMRLSTSYYIRAYAVNSIGISYGNQITVTIFPTAPILNTVDLTQITGNSAMSGGIITSDGGAPVTLKGLCWNTSTNPITSNSYTTNGLGTDPFTAMVSGLLPNTLYYVRAYAINRIGTAYGIEKTFQTNGVPTLTGMLPVTNIIATTATSGGVITDDGRTRILSRGICWSTYSNPDVSLATKTVDTTAISLGSFIANMKGLTPGTSYYVRSYATNAVGTGYGSQVMFTTLPVMLPSLTTIHPYNVDTIKATGGGNIFDDGGMPVTVRGICWSTTPNPTNALVTRINNATGGDSIFTNTMAGLLPATKYYVRAYATNSKGTGYGNQDSLTTMALRPTISNVVFSNITQSAATGTASVLTDGGALVTSRGLCWNTTGIPTIADNLMQEGTGIGSFTDSLTNKVQGPTYCVRAYATNSAGTAYSPVVSSFVICPSSFTVLHVAGFNGAAVDKTVIYHSVSSALSGKAVCWLTQNLGADQQATSAGDATEASAGWYWQFNRVQGYKNDGTTRTPASSWITSISEASDWLPANDPCKLLLGSGWRIPTLTEWGNVITNGNMASTSAFASALKLHLAGLLYYADGTLSQRGMYGYCHASTQQSASVGNVFEINPGNTILTTNAKTWAFSVRCLRDSLIISRPSVSNVTVSNMTSTTTDVSAVVSPDGGATVTARGICWNTTGNPVITDNPVPNGTGTGNFTSTLTGLTQGSTYYVRAYASNSAGINYSPVVTIFKVCPQTFTVQHFQGLDGAPVDKTVVYHSVSSALSGKAACWLTQNLGADQQATSATDATESSAGWYWQFNRVQGYKNDGTTRTPSSSWINSISEASDWLPANDPCKLLLGSGWRIPTLTEWGNVITNGNMVSTSAFSSVLKLHLAGLLYYSDGTLSQRGMYGYCQASTQLSASVGNLFETNPGNTILFTNAKSWAFSVRCLRDSLIISIPSVSNVLVSNLTTTTVDVTAAVAPDGGANVTARGMCWNTTGNPVITDNPVPNGTGTGSFTSTLSGLTEGTYYVRAYATNSMGTAYSPIVANFKICPAAFTVQHVQGLNGAPVSKTVTYHSVSTNLSGKVACWLTQNLGADSIATSLGDATDKSAGWFWQFNRPQGYKNDGTGLVPATGWVSSISENSNWIPANDPCNLLLGSGWRIPTTAEWGNVVTNTAGLTYGSALKLHLSGMIRSGSNLQRGQYGYVQGSTQNDATSRSSWYFSGAAGYTSCTLDKTTDAVPLRCIKDTLVITKPSVSQVIVSSMTQNSANITASVTPDGGSPVTSRGFCWNTTGNPTITDNPVSMGSGLGTFNATISGLTQSPVYYVRAYAANSTGISYSQVVTSFKVCASTFAVQHFAGINGAPVSKTVTYHSVSTTLSGKDACWLTQNLGADSIPTSLADATDKSAGWFWQFNRPQGYKNDGTVLIPATGWVNGISENSNWIQANDPCNLLLGSGWRIPTLAEWGNVVTNSGGLTYGSALKLHLSGMIRSGGLLQRGQYGYTGCSTQNNATSRISWYFSGLVGYTSSTLDKSTDAVPLRCIRDSFVVAMPTESQVTISSMTQTSVDLTASVTPDGGSPVTSRGFCWNTTGNPVITDNPISMGAGLGSFTTTLNGLTVGPTYFVRAYATNSNGTSYSSVVTKFIICTPQFTVQHTQGINGAPVSKTVVYHSVYSTLSGKSACWLTQNLGADSIATSVNDATDKSAGWFWQFNRPQGYKNDGTGLVPSTGWVSSISENSNWVTANDPCNLLLGSGWRIPTLAEWANVVTNTAGLTYGSALKLHTAGMIRSSSNLQRGQYGYVQGSTQNDATSRSSWYYSGLVGYTSCTLDKTTDAVSLRCLRDTIIITLPSVSDVTVPTASMTVNTAVGSATVTSDGGATLSARGLCWNTTGNPTIADNTVSTGNGSGSISEVLSSLIEGPTYYVLAFATNTKGTAYSSHVTSFKICNPFMAIHVAGLNGAPVSKVVTYKTVNTSISGAPRCWLTQNLGADQQATSATDATEPSAGWYWQFNRLQGYQFTTVQTPSTWVSTISENSDWIAANDPCKLLLGRGWRIPTYLEWSNVQGAPQNWINSSDTYNSVLKIHAAGVIKNSGLIERGITGMYWGSTQMSNANGGDLGFNASSSMVESSSKSVFANSLRCLRDTVSIDIPIVTDVTVPTSTMTANSAAGSATVISDGGATLLTRGICWNTTGNPTITNNAISTGNGIGVISETLTGLVQGPTYYVRGYATNSKGTGYSANVSSFKICPTTFTLTHTAGINGAPVTKTITYGSVSSILSGAAKCWLTQNLGADQQATSVTDATEPSAGWYWQFNNPQGYQFTTVRTPITAWTGGISQNSDWLSANDPCRLLLGTGWRLPTYNEWFNADGAPRNWSTPADVFASELKLHAAGYLDTGGALNVRGANGYYWSSNQFSNTSYAYFMHFYPGYADATYQNKAFGSSVRCLCDTVVLSVSDVVIPTATMTATTAIGSGVIISDGGFPITSRGLCWNTTGNPVITDHTVSTGVSSGSFTETIPGLIEGPTYYVRGYATNAKGTAYSTIVTSFKICNPVTIMHTAGINGAPVTKTVTYHSVSTNISGAAKCWLTQNLGADQQASSVSDATEPSAGWYWQFNNAQGYQYTTVRTPATAWTGGVSQNSDWLPANDPCTLMLGAGWRLPTYNEWFNADGAPRNWSTPADVFASELKLHAAGYLDTGGALNVRGANGYYWASTQFSNTSYAYFMHFYSGYADATYQNKAFGSSVRCLRDTVVLQVSDVVVSIAANTATGSANVLSDGGYSLSSRGICWNTTGNPSIADNTIATGSGVGSITETITGLSNGITYYVRAYATNINGTVYSTNVTTFKVCSSLTTTHVAGLEGAPVTKTVTYKLVATTVSGALKCWLAQNLGADQQATSASDATEPSAGWYWQFNRSQGYKYDVATLTPLAWNGNVTESSDWLPANDPCANLLGTGWRIPTLTEWTNAQGSPQNWNTTADAFASVLKLHQAGDLLDANGVIESSSRGTYGYFWSSTQYSSGNGNYYFINNGTFRNAPKAYGFSLRCLCDAAVLSVSDVLVPSSSITSSTATGVATVNSDGGTPITARGVCWNTTGNPTIIDNKISTGSGVGSISEVLTGLLNGITYYVRAYATNITGIVYSTNVTTFKICNPITTTHIAGLEGAPVTKTVTYNLVGTNISGALKCWLAQNLGADQQATSATDATEASAGWYWQFNRSQGYKYDVATRTPGIIWNSNITESSDWLPANDPCALLLGSGWRIPTLTEWTNAHGSPQNWNTTADAYASVLRLHQGGNLVNTNGVIESSSRGTLGYYWSSTQNSSANGNYYYTNTGSFYNTPKAYGFSVRCICDVALFSVSDALFPASSMTATTATGSATVYSDGGAPITSRGLCWNTTGNPTISDNKVATGNGVGSISETLTGLVVGSVYYVRAYATNSSGTVYSTNTSSFKFCPVNFTLTHTAGVNGAPVTKTITYNSVSSNLSGALKCWLTQNLGADHQAASVSDATEPSAGWYWQFNNSQGYQYTTVRTPATAWNGSISENSDWLPANDPCTLLLGSGWRIPTYSEWINADAAPQNWASPADVFASELKLHEAGYIDMSDGTLYNRGGYGYYWTATQNSNTSKGNFMYFYSGFADVINYYKANGTSVRCLKD